MKTKLTLTVKKNIIENAKRMAKSRGISLSQMFEEVFGEGDINNLKTASQKAAERLLERLEKSEVVKQKDDKSLLKEYVKRKFA